MRVAIVPGDGVGPEVVAVALRVLHAVAPADVTAAERVETAVAKDLASRVPGRPTDAVGDAVLGLL